jgi:hypothetical protein
MMTKLIIFSMIMLITACGSASLEDHKGSLPVLKLEQFFDGKLKAYGMVQDRSGKLLRRFEVDLEAQWKGNKGEIKEWFSFDDGEKTTRVWHLEHDGKGGYTGTASDVIGIARGQTQGSALFWQYDLDIEVDGSSYQITLDDWMFLLDEKRLFNKTDMTKFGIKVAELTLYIEKVSP